MNSNLMMQKLVLSRRWSRAAVLYVLLALSVLSIGVIIERWWFFRRRRDDVDGSRRRLRRRCARGDVAAARKRARREPLGRGGDHRRGARLVRRRAPTPSSRSWPRRSRARRKSFEAGLLFLGTLGNNAPFIGLFGTVLGIVTAFRELGSSQIGRRDGQRHGRHRRGADRDGGRHPGRAPRRHLLQRVPEEGRRRRGAARPRSATSCSRR